MKHLAVPEDSVYKTGSTMSRPTALLLLASAIAFSGCGNAEREPVNIIWITWDSTRADHLSSYGYPRPTSPQLDAFAEQAVLFETAIAQHNWTQPSYASMLTSLHFWQMPGWALSPDNVTLAEILQESGYDTFGFVQNPNLAAELHFDQGFDLYERLPDNMLGEPSALYFPTRGPRLIRIPKAKNPEIICTTPEAPKSWYPQPVTIQPA